MKKLSCVSLYIIFYTILVLSMAGCQRDNKQEHDKHIEDMQTSEQEHEHEHGNEHEHKGEHNEEAGAIILDEKTIKLIDLKTAEAVITDFEETITVPGKIIDNENNKVHINTLIPGRINVLMANWGDKVKKEQPLVCIESIELGKKRAEYDKAYAELELAVANYERKRRLFEKEAVSQKLFLEAEIQKKSAEINLEYAWKMLRMTGLKEDEINVPPDEHNVIEGCSVHLVSPINGVVIERNVKRGEQVEPGKCLFKILDVSSVWIEADVFEKDLHYLRQGVPIKFTVQAYSDRVFTGKIFRIGSTLNEETRTVKIRSEVANKDRMLKPGMFAAVEIITETKNNVIAVPKEAVLSEDTLNFVFFKEGNRYHRHPVMVGCVSGGFAEIISGVSVSDLVVIKGNYQLKTRLMMSGSDSHAGHTH